MYTNRQEVSANGAEPQVRCRRSSKGLSALQLVAIVYLGLRPRLVYAAPLALYPLLFQQHCLRLSSCHPSSQDRHRCVLSALISDCISLASRRRAPYTENGRNLRDKH